MQQNFHNPWGRIIYYIKVKILDPVQYINDSLDAEYDVTHSRIP